MVLQTEYQQTLDMKNYLFVRRKKRNRIDKDRGNKIKVNQTQEGNGRKGKSSQE